MHKSVIPGIGMIAMMCVAGCGSKPPVTVYPVSGQVLYEGRPAKGVHVFFYPTSAPAVPDIPANPHGVTGADGRFMLTTYVDGDGAAEGGYQVILLWPNEKKEGEEDSDSDRLLGWYTGVHTKLTAQVKAEDNRIPPFDLPKVTRPPDPVQGIPGRN